MVFLTRIWLIQSLPYRGYTRRYKPPSLDKSWKKDMYRRLTWHMRDRKRNCYALQRDAVRRSLKFSTTSRDIQKVRITNIWSDRIAAGCTEHGVQYTSFMRSMYENNIALNKKMLSTLAAYEPRSFQSLCEFSKKQHTERVKSGLASGLEHSPSGIISRDMLDKISRGQD